jgi:hypothetical protein
MLVMNRGERRLHVLDLNGAWPRTGRGTTSDGALALGETKFMLRVVACITVHNG